MTLGNSIFFRMSELESDIAQHEIIGLIFFITFTVYACIFKKLIGFVGDEIITAR